MWTINGRPTLRKALNDAEKTERHSTRLNATDLVALKALYTNYESKSGRVDVADLAPLNVKADIISDQYAKTTGTELLSYIRTDLMKGIERCPMCSLLSATELDHFWNKSQYGQLAVCRLNLVPICGKCNKLKSNKSTDEFVHAYYDQFPPGVVFFKADCKIVSGYLVPRFRIDGAGLADPTLTNRLNRQIVEVKLRNRLRAASKEYIRKLFQGTTFRTNRALNNYLREAEIRHINEFGLNDWRTALDRGIRQCAGMNMTIVLNYRRSASISRDGRT